MELILKPKDFIRNVDKSTYNHNYYNCISHEINNNTEIFEKCDENYETFSYYLVDKENFMFLGDCYDSLGCDKEQISIDFRLRYT